MDDNLNSKLKFEYDNNNSYHSEANIYGNQANEKITNKQHDNFIEDTKFEQTFNEDDIVEIHELDVTQPSILNSNFSEPLVSPKQNRKGKTKITAEMANFLRDMPFGLGNDIDERITDLENIPKSPKLEKTTPASQKVSNPPISPQKITVNVAKYTVKKISRSPSPNKQEPEVDEIKAIRQNSETMRVKSPKKQKPVKKPTLDIDIFDNPTPFQWQKKPEKERERPKTTIQNKKQTQSNLSTKPPNCTQPNGSNYYPTQAPTKSNYYPNQIYVPIEQHPTPHNQYEKVKPQPQVSQTPKSHKVHISTPQKTYLQTSKTPKPKSSPSPKQARKSDGIEKPLEIPDIGTVFNEANTFLTQVDQNKAMQAYEEDKRPVPEPEPEPIPKSKPKTAASNRRRMTAAMMSFLGPPRIKETHSVNLSKYDGVDDFDISDCHIPPLLLALIDWPEDSILYHALCGSQLQEIPPEAVSKVVVELKRLLEKCIKKGYITESAFVQSALDALKESRVNKHQHQNTEQLQNRLGRAEEQLERSRREKRQQLADLEAERDELIEDLEERQTAALDGLEDEWNSDLIRSKFNKPSPSLINRRHEAMINLRAHRFDDAAQIAIEVEKLEKEETEEAARRMLLAFGQARNRLIKRFENERQAIEDQFQNKKNRLQNEAIAMDRPLVSRISKLNHQLEQIEINERNASKKDKEYEQSPKKIPNAQPIVLESRLQLPPLDHITRPRTSKSSLK